METKTKRKAKVVSEYNRLRKRRAQIGKDISEDIATLHTSIEILMENITIAYLFGIEVGRAGYDENGHKVKPKVV